MVSRILILIAFTRLGLLGNEAVRPEYLQDDLEGASAVGKLIPIELHTARSIGRIVGVAEPEQDDDTGFGGRLFAFAKGHGYTTIRVRGLTFKDRLGWVSLSLESYSSKWKAIRERVLGAWKAGGGPALTCGENECVHEWVDESVIGAYKRSVAVYLGSPKTAPVSDNVKAHYEYLMSPFETTLLGPGACGLPVPGEPLRWLPGREAIQALVDAREIDLIANVLRGYNPGARVYALLALKRLQDRGETLPSDVRASMRKVQNLSVPVSTCMGCIVNRGLRATDVVKRWREYEP